MSSARLEPTLRPTGTEGVPQNRPLLMPEVAKLASVDATARSQAATSWQPAAVAMACTLAITGRGQALDRHHHGRAAREQVVVEGVVTPRRHLLQVMAG